MEAVALGWKMEQEDMSGTCRNGLVVLAGDVWSCLAYSASGDDMISRSLSYQYVVVSVCLSDSCFLPSLPCSQTSIKETQPTSMAQTLDRGSTYRIS
jgi:hypothetical protein